MTLTESPYSNSKWRDKNWPSYLPRELRFEMGERPLHDYLTAHAKKNPDGPALVFFNRTISFDEWDKMSNAFAGFLIAKGIEKGDRIAIFLPTCPAFAIVYMGILKAGATVTALSPAFKEWELEYQLKDSGARILISLDGYMSTVLPVLTNVDLEFIVVTGHRDFLNESCTDKIPDEYLDERKYFPDTIELIDILSSFDATPPEVRIDLHRDIALIQYTGGTTGLPKGAMHTYYNVIYKTAAMSQVAYYGLFQKDGPHYILHMSPIYHIAGMLQFNSNVYKGLGQIFFPRFDPLLAMQTIDHYKPELLMTTTPMNIGMMNHPSIGDFN
ncbi:MAG: AMP-binding protein, partial [Syntrophales bacterium]|nr:AMP-binding protein [Syntrophales bacterium]